MQDTFDLKDEALLKASGALTGGIGGLADTCGSMIGATLVLGSVCGRGRDDEMTKLEKSKLQAADYYTWFKGENGKVNCRDIVTEYGNGTFYDLGDPAQHKAAWEAGVTQKCAILVQNNVTRAAEILWDELHPGE